MIWIIVLWFLIALNLNNKKIHEQKKKKRKKKKNREIAHTPVRNTSTSYGEFSIVIHWNITKSGANVPIVQFA